LAAGATAVPAGSVSTGLLGPFVFAGFPNDFSGTKSVAFARGAGPFALFGQTIVTLGAGGAGHFQFRLAATKTAPSVPWLSFLEGDPGSPGDNAGIGPTGGRIPHDFELLAPIGLANTAGVTLTTFSSPHIQNAREFLITITNLHASAECKQRTATSTFGTGAIVVVVNGATGIAEHFSSDVLHSIVDVHNSSNPSNCPAVTLGDLYVVGLQRATFPLDRMLDAARIELQR
jgi:hypothetical protein